MMKQMMMKEKLNSKMSWIKTKLSKILRGGTRYQRMYGLSNLVKIPIEVMVSTWLHLLLRSKVSFHRVDIVDQRQVD